MTETVEQVYLGVRQILGDVDEPGGGSATNERLQEPYKRAYGDLIARMAQSGLGRARKTVFYNLPLKTTVLTPSQMGVEDFGEVQFVHERGGLTVAAVTAASASTPIVLTASSHGLPDYAQVVVSEVSPEANGRWFINLDEGDPANKFSLRGSASATAYSGLNGDVSASSERFVRLSPLGSARDFARMEPGEALLQYDFRDETLFFRGSTQMRQLKIEYLSNGNPPLTGSVGIDGAGNFLKARTAQYFAPSEGMHTRARELMVDAQNALDLMIGTMEKNLARRRYRPKSRLARIRQNRYH